MEIVSGKPPFNRELITLEGVKYRPHPIPAILSPRSELSHWDKKPNPMLDKKANYSIAVFPFLKTTATTKLGSILFRSTDDTANLPSDQALSVKQIASMLFLKDNFRIKTASYAIIPFVDLTNKPAGLDYLINIQAFVSYLYLSPRHEFGDIFFPTEHSSLVIFTPGMIMKALLEQSYHVQKVGNIKGLVANDRGEVDGFTGLYNFQHHFWVTKGSRIYGPTPQITLNQSQNLNMDVERAIKARSDYQLLHRSLRKQPSETSSKMFTALLWFNSANESSLEQSTAIVHLSIAFETLLGLPFEDKTERLADVISMLLGRIRRLDNWARQFYKARSQIVHEGRIDQLRFAATDAKKYDDSPLYQSLLSYGRQVFQLCLGTLLVGADLAEAAGLEQTFLTNQERFQEVCKILSKDAVSASERLEQIESLVATIEQYHYVHESDLKIETMLGAIRLALQVLTEEDRSLPKELTDAFSLLINAKSAKDNLPELEALEAIHEHLRARDILSASPFLITVRNLVNTVWYYVFMHYFWLKKRHS